jgi:hypothetical protein
VTVDDADELLGQRREDGELAGDGVLCPMPPAGIQVAQEVGRDHVQVDVFCRPAIGARTTCADPDLEPGGELDEGRDLELESAGPQAGQAGRALRPVLRALSGARLSLLPPSAPPEDPVLRSARGVVDIAIRPGQVPHELHDQVVRHG